jgi:hypothetical protein
VIRVTHKLAAVCCVVVFVSDLIIRCCYYHVLQPKAYAYFELITPEVYSSPRAVAALKLFQMSVDDALSEYRLALPILLHNATTHCTSVHACVLTCSTQDAVSVSKH